MIKGTQVPVQLFPIPNRKDSGICKDVFQWHFNQEILCKTTLYIVTNGKVQCTSQSGKTDHNILCLTESSETLVNEHSFTSKDEKPNGKVLSISEVTKSTIYREFDSVWEGLHQTSTTKAGFLAMT